MDLELTFSPSIRKLPSSYKQPANEGFDQRAANWQAEKELKRSQLQAEAKVNELEGCSFQPTMTSSRNSFREDNFLGTSRNSTNTNNNNDNDTESASPSPTKNADLTVQRLYYKETRRLAERRKQERQRHEREEQEQIDKTCTFKPSLAASAGGYHNSTGGITEQEDVGPRYLNDTQAVERRRILWQVGELVAPGPGEYELDSGGPDLSAGNSHDHTAINTSGGDDYFQGGMMNSSTVSGGGGNKSKNKNWR